MGKICLLFLTCKSCRIDFLYSWSVPASGICGT